jgi:hypothetical protein
MARQLAWPLFTGRAEDELIHHIYAIRPRDDYNDSNLCIDLSI